LTVLNLTNLEGKFSKSAHKHQYTRLCNWRKWRFME